MATDIFGLPVAESSERDIFGLPVLGRRSPGVFGASIGATARPDVQFGIGAAGSLDDSIGRFRTSYLGQVMEQRRLELLMRNGMDPNQDPTEWTPEKAKAQTDAAIAKIATINPGLAQQLQDERKSGDQHDPGFFGELWSGVKEGFAKTFEFLGRPARIIPELITDKDGNDPWYEDVWDALSGKSKATWSDALDKMGVQNNVVKGIFGFALDVALDPLTYVTFGAAGVGRQVLARTTARSVFGEVVGREAAERMARQLSKQGVRHFADKEGAEALTALWNHTVRAGMDPDAAAGAVQMALVGADRQLYMRGFEAADEVSRALQTVGFKNMPSQIPLRSGGVVTKDDVFRSLEGLRREGILAGRAGYRQAKAAGGAIGGVRFRVPLVRWVSPAIPGTEGLGFQDARRFFVGQSGLVRLASAIEAGTAGVSWDDFTRWATEGASKAIEANPALRHLAGGPGNLGSMMWSASERVGKMTALRSNHALAIRGGGLQGAMMAAFSAEAKTFKRRFIDETALTLEEDGKKWGAEDLQRDFWQNLAKAGKATPEDRLRQRRFLEMVPSREAARDLDGWWQTHVFDPIQRTVRSEKELEERMLREEQRLQEAKEVLEEAKSHGELDSLLRYRATQDNIRDAGRLYAAPVRDTSVNAEDAAMIRPTQMHVWNGGTETAGATYTLRPLDGDEYLRWMGAGLSPEDVHSGSRFAMDGVGYGVHLVKGGDPWTAGKRAAESMTAQVRLRNPVRGMGKWDELRTEVEPIIKQEYEAKVAGGLLDADYNQYLDEALTRRAESEGFDGRLWVDEDGHEHAVVFSPANVKVQNPSAPLLVHNRGYFPREFSQQLKDAIGRKHKPDEITLVVSELRHAMERDLGDLTFDEAAAEVRKSLRKNGYDIPDDVPIWEEDLLKVHRDYTGAFADAILGEAAGRVLRRFKDFGTYFPGNMGGVVGQTLYRYSQFVPPKVLDQLDKEAQQTYERYVGRLEQAERSRIQAALGIQENLLNLRARLDGPLFEDFTKGPRKGQPKGGTVELRQALIEATERSKTLREELKGAGKNGARQADEVKADIESLRQQMSELRVASRKGEGGLERGRALKSALSASERELDQVEDAVADAERVLNEHNRLRAMYRTELADASPALLPQHPNKTGYVEVKLPGQKQGMWAHPAVAEEVNALVRRMGGQPEFRRFWRSQVMARWKTWATVMNLGFHARNNLGAFFNNLMGSVDMTDYDHAWKMMRTVRDPEYGATRKLGDAVVARYHLSSWDLTGESTYRDLLRLADQDQVTSASARGFADRMGDPFVQNPLEPGPGIPGVNVRRRGPLGKAVDVTQKKVAEPLTAQTENLHRFAAYLGGMRESVGDRQAARLSTMMRHGDYVDLNDWEMGLVRDVLPFYKWLRTNLPYQVHNLFEAPGHQLTWLKFRDMLWNVHGEDFDEMKARVPKWMRDEFFIPLPFGAGGGEALHTMMLDLPMSDLGAGLNEYISMFLPTVRPLVEAMVTEKVTFSGKPLEGKAVPMPGFLSPIGWALDHLGIAQKDADGNYTINDKLAHVLTVLPIYSRYRNWLTAEPDRVKLRSHTLASAFFGVGIRDIDEDSLTASELEFYFRNVSPMMTQLRSLGVQFPEARDLSPDVFSALGLEVPEQK